MGITRFVNRLSLGVQLNVAFVVTFLLLFIEITVMLNLNVRAMTAQTVQRRIEQEVAVIRTRITESEQDLLSAASLLAKSPGLAELVAQGSSAQVHGIVAVEGAPLRFDNVEVVDLDRQRLTILAADATAYDTAAEDKLLGLGLVGAQVTGIVSQTDGTGLLLTAVTPLKATSGAMVGALLAARKIDQDFLTTINFTRKDIHIAVVNAGQIVAYDSSQQEPAPGISADPAVEQALHGQTVIASDLVYMADGTPRNRAFVPLTVGGDVYGVLVVENELQEVVTLQNQLITSTAVGVILLAALAVVISVLVVRSRVTDPLSRLKAEAQQMARGNYLQRAPVSSEDEIGQLAQAFNEMAVAVERRDTDLVKAAETLENRVAQRTAELQKANDEVREASRLKDEFLATMSHELRTPLNAILGFTGILLEGMSGEIDDAARSMLLCIEESSKRLLSLINNILDIARIEAGRFELVTETITLNDLVRKWRDEMEVLANQKHLIFDITVDPELPSQVQGDEERLTQVVVNLLSNAFKFTENGRVSLDLKRQADQWLLVIQDTGIGIPAHAIEYIFDEFRQVDGSSSRLYGGTGLGLAIVRKLCSAMGGTIRVSSMLGEGSTFTVTLPLEGATELPSPKVLSGV